MTKPASDHVLETVNLTALYSRRAVVKEISIRFPPGP